MNDGGEQMKISCNSAFMIMFSVSSFVSFSIEIGIDKFIARIRRESKIRSVGHFMSIPSRVSGILIIMRCIQICRPLWE